MWEVERNRNIKSEAKEGRKNRLDKETRHQYNQKRGTKRKRERKFSNSSHSRSSTGTNEPSLCISTTNSTNTRTCHCMECFDWLLLPLTRILSFSLTSVVAIFAHIHNHVEYFSNFNILCAFWPNNNNNNIAFKWCNDVADCHRNTENAILLKWITHTHRTNEINK